MKNLGFTLIELMIVVAVVGILAMIAYPNYTSYIQRGQRGEAQADLSELAQYMERFYTENNRYPAAGASLPFSNSPRSGAAARYTLSISAATNNTFTLTATPQGAQANDACGTLTINHQGSKTPSTGNCW